MLGIFLVLIGIVWLLSATGVITTSIASVIWPIVVIAIGLALLLKKGHWMKRWCCGGWEKGGMHKHEMPGMSDEEEKIE